MWKIEADRKQTRLADKSMSFDHQRGIKVPTGSFNTANLDTTYMTFTYAPLARTQLHDETVFLCIQEEKKRNSVQN